MSDVVRVQRSADQHACDTRSFSAEVKVTPFSSANGSFIDWIVSSGVIAFPPLPPAGHSALARSINLILMFEMMECRVKPAMTHEVRPDFPQAARARWPR